MNNKFKNNDLDLINTYIKYFKITLPLTIILLIPLLLTFISLPSFISCLYFSDEYNICFASENYNNYKWFVGFFSDIKFNLILPVFNFITIVILLIFIILAFKKFKEKFIYEREIEQIELYFIYIKTILFSLKILLILLLLFWWSGICFMNLLKIF